MVFFVLVIALLFPLATAEYDNSYLGNDKLFYPKLLEMTGKAIENYNKFKDVFQAEQVCSQVFSAASTFSSLSLPANAWRAKRVQKV